MRMLCLIDASHFIFRAYHALPPLTLSDGTPVGALYGFLSMLLKLVQSHAPPSMGIIFDSRTPSFRKTLFSAYKANRPPPPPDLGPQFDLIKQALKAFHLPIIEEEGFEADDLMASYALEAAQKGQKVMIVSSDKDLMQLVSENIYLWDPMKAKEIHSPEVEAKFGVPPSHVVEIQALMGDSSDNIPGVPGVGPKTAQNLIAQFQNIETLYENLSALTKPRLKRLLMQHKDNVFLSRKLATLKTDIPLPVPLKDLVFKGLFCEEGAAFLKKYAFHTLLKRFQTLHNDQPDTAPLLEWADFRPTGTQAATFNIAQRDAFIKGVHEEGVLAAAYQKDIACLTFFSPQSGGLFLEAHADMTLDHSLSSFLAPLYALLTNTRVLKIIHNVPTFIKDLKALPVFKDGSFTLERLTPFEDTALMTYLLEGPLKDDSPDKTRTFQEASQPPAFREELLEEEKLALTKAYATSVLYKESPPALAQRKLWALYRRVDLPLLYVLSHMEARGIALNTPFLKELGAQFEADIKRFEERVHHLAGRVFNVASPKQLAEVLFEEMELKTTGRKGKSGVYSTKSSVIEALDHPIAEPLLHFRQLSKLHNTYSEGLSKAVSKVGRLHTTYLTTQTATGRLSSVEPNLQNIPVREERGRLIRRAFIPSDNNVLLSLDYSQIELRLLAHMGSVAPLREAFSKGLDIHLKTASEMFDKPLDAVTPDERRTAKMINFGIIYGMSGFGLASRLAITRQKADDYIQHYMQHYQGIETYMKTQIDTARLNGYVKTLWGRRCFIKDIKSMNPSVRHASERLAINAPLQGTSADLIKKAMIHLDHFISDTKLPIKMLLHIHDELLFEGPLESLKTHAPRFATLMQNVTQLSVPLQINASLGNNWDALTPLPLL